MIADTAQTSKIVVEKSTVPVKAAESVSTILRTNHKKGVKYQVGCRQKFELENSCYVSVVFLNELIELIYTELVTLFVPMIYSIVITINTS